PWTGPPRARFRARRRPRPVGAGGDRARHPLPPDRPETRGHGPKRPADALVFPQSARGIALRSPRRRTDMGIIAFIILGLLAGLIAKAILPGDDPGGVIVTALIGIAGALIGGFVASAVFDAH